jgi:hypothetical protein
MKEKILLYFLLLTAFVSCDKSLTSDKVENMLRSNTFITTLKGSSVSHTIDFQDSTYAVFENENRELTWEVISQDNKVYLGGSSGPLEIYDVDINSIKGRVITNDSLEIILTKQDVVNDKEKLYGTWVEEIYSHSMKNDNPPPPPPPGPEGCSDDDYQFPPIYEIRENNISVRFDCFTNNSDVLIFNSVCCIMMKLDRSYAKKTDTLWEIINVNDSILTINRSSRPSYGSSEFFYDENVRFIKIEN